MQGRTLLDPPPNRYVHMGRLVIFLLLSLLASFGRIAAAARPPCGDQLCPTRGLIDDDDDDEPLITSIITAQLFEKMLSQRNKSPCEGEFYTYDAFVSAATHFKGRIFTGDLETRTREVAAFFAQTAHQTRGPGLPGAGYCWVRQPDADGSYCVHSREWPCVADQNYFGRGPMQITYNNMYGPAGVALGVDLLSQPDLLATNGSLSFESAMWFWVTPQGPKPSCHDVMVGHWKPSLADVAAGRFPGFGLTTNIINGRFECGFNGNDELAENRIRLYKTFCDLLGVSYGSHLHCYAQRPFASAPHPESVSSMK